MQVQRHNHQGSPTYARCCSSDTSGLLRSNLVFSLEFLRITTLNYLFVDALIQKILNLVFRNLEIAERPFLVQFSILYAGQGISRQISDAFIVYLALISGAQQANVTGLIDHEQVFDRVALLLATIIFLLVLGISRAVDRAFSAIMPKRGGMGTPSARGLASSMAKSSAVRAGSRSCRANA